MKKVIISAMENAYKPLEEKTPYTIKPPHDEYIQHAESFLKEFAEMHDVELRLRYDGLATEEWFDQASIKPSRPELQTHYRELLDELNAWVKERQK
jgi:hypothetical protein